MLDVTTSVDAIRAAAPRYGKPLGARTRGYVWASRVNQVGSPVRACLIDHLRTFEREGAARSDQPGRRGAGTRPRLDPPGIAGPGRYSLDHVTGHCLDRPWAVALAFSVGAVAAGVVLKRRTELLQRRTRAAAAAEPEGEVVVS